MYQPLKRLALEVLKTPEAPPAPPSGTEGSVEVFRASPRFLRYRMLGFWLRACTFGVLELVALATGFATGQPVVSVIAFVAAIAILVHMLLDYFAIRLDYDLRHYIVTDRALRVREGAWTVREMTITHANVQNLRIVQGPVQRLFGFAALEVDTAGGGGAAASQGRHGIASGHTVRLAGIENSADIRDRILAHLRARGGGGAGLGDVDDEDERAPLAPAAAPAAASQTASTPPPAPGVTVTDALRELLDSARGLRSAAERRAPG